MLLLFKAEFQHQPAKTEVLLCEDEADLQLLLAEAAFATACQETAMDRGPSRLWVCLYGRQSHARETSGHEGRRAVCFGLSLSARVSLEQTPCGTQTPRALAAADVPPATSTAAARIRVQAWLPGGLWGQKVTSAGPSAPR